MGGRHRILDLIQTMDPVREHERIVRLSGLWDFPWDGARALELALFRTFAVPSIGGLLHRTGEFTRRPQKRYDDTELLIAEIVDDVHDTYEAFNVAYERAHFRHTPKNAAVAAATLDLFCSWYLPRRLWPLGRRAVCALLDPPLLDALGLHPRTVTDRPHRSHPEGHRIEALGPAA